VRPARVVRRTLVLVGIACAFAACGGEKEKAAGPRQDPARERVLAFWRSYNAATAARVAGDCEKAAPLYEEALKLDPRHEDSLYYLGQCRRDLHQPAAARTALERLVEVNPASARGHSALGSLLASNDPSEPLDLESAERHLRRAHEINKEETGPMVRLGEVLLVEGRSDEARRWLEDAIRTNPRSVDAALLAAYLERPAAVTPARLDGVAHRLQAAAAVARPTKDVPGEGDRRDAAGHAAPPLEKPHGRLLFEEPVRKLRARAAEGHSLTGADVAEAWAGVDRALATLRRRASAGGQGELPAGATKTR
jgi:tetratricopeptide (TPR) repeat protein